MIARHLARFLLSETEADLSDPGRQIALLTDPRYVGGHGELLKRLGAAEDGERIRRLYDAVASLGVRMAGQRAQEREATYQAIRKAVADAAGDVATNPNGR
jgi:hypothetical protein